MTRLHRETQSKCQKWSYWRFLAPTMTMNKYQWPQLSKNYHLDPHSYQPSVTPNWSANWRASYKTRRKDWRQLRVTLYRCCKRISTWKNNWNKTIKNWKRHWDSRLGLKNNYKHRTLRGCNRGSEITKYKVIMCQATWPCPRACNHAWSIRGSWRAKDILWWLRDSNSIWLHVAPAKMWTVQHRDHCSRYSNLIRDKCPVWAKIAKSPKDSR